MKAQLVYDGGMVHLPESVGQPNANQFQGTTIEQLGETASRICYDSYGLHENGKPKGRSSELLHEHILQVINLSVYEHGNVTIRFRLEKCPFTLLSFLRAFMNRKGVYTWLVTENPYPVVDVTFNARAVLEWVRHYRPMNKTTVAHAIQYVLQKYMHDRAPMIVQAPQEQLFGGSDIAYMLRQSDEVPTAELEPDQAWISIWLRGSRGFTHEMVRHRFAMSQRSTRYVNESESDWAIHELIEQYLDDPNTPAADVEHTREYIANTIDDAKLTYNTLNRTLNDYLIGKGVAADIAKKQARGASRGFLGNALMSEMIYSAPVAGWWWIFKQRLSQFADAEIRGIMAEALPLVKASSRYGHHFKCFELVDSPDGLGQMLDDSVLLPTLQC